MAEFKASSFNTGCFANDNNKADMQIKASDKKFVFFMALFIQQFSAFANNEKD